MTFWHGQDSQRMGPNRWVEYWTDGKGQFVDIRDVGTRVHSSRLTYLHPTGKVNKDPGHGGCVRPATIRCRLRVMTAAEHLLKENEGYGRGLARLRLEGGLPELAPWWWNEIVGKWRFIASTRPPLTTVTPLGRAGHRPAITDWMRRPRPLRENPVCRATSTCFAVFRRYGSRPPLVIAGALKAGQRPIHRVILVEQCRCSSPVLPRFCRFSRLGPIGPPDSLAFQGTSFTFHCSHHSFSVGGVRQWRRGSDGAAQAPGWNISDCAWRGRWWWCWSGRFHYCVQAP